MADIRNRRLQEKLSLYASGSIYENALHRIGRLLEYKIKENIVRKGLVDHGYLLNSIGYEVTMDKTGGTVIIGSRGVKYAAIHEYGGIIEPRRARALTIPIAPWAKYRRAKDFRLIRIGSLLVDPTKIPPNATRIPEDAKGFRLARRVTIKPKYYMRDALAESLPRIIRILSET